MPITSIISVAPPGVALIPDTAILMHHITAPVLIPSFSDIGERDANNVSLSNELRSLRIEAVSLRTFLTSSKSVVYECELLIFYCVFYSV